MKRALLGLALVAACTPPPAVQPGNEPRLGIVVVDPPVVGRRLPPLVLPYATRDGVGPADQPFDIARELGLVVVVSFCRLDFADECLAQWRQFRDQQATLFGANVVVTGVTTDSAAGAMRFAQDHQLPFKFLIDPAKEVAKRFGFTAGNSVRHTIVVVGRDGRVRYIDPRFASTDPTSYSKLAAAVNAAKES